MAAGDIQGTPEGEHLEEDTHGEEHQDILAGEALPVDILVEEEHLVGNLAEELPGDILVEGHLHIVAGSNPAGGKLGPVQGSLAVLGGPGRHRDCTHQAWGCRLGPGMAWACPQLVLLGRGGGQVLLRRGWEQQLADELGEQSCQGRRH